jgi:hypothetical protein
VSRRWLAACVTLKLMAAGALGAQDRFEAPARERRDLEDSEAADNPQQSDRALSHDELARMLARYAAEPSVAQVVAEALRAERRDPRRFAAMARRARLRGLIPNLDVGARRGQGLVLRSTTSDDAGILPTTDNDLMLFATLRFDLGRLLFAGEEVSIAREARFEAQARRELVRQVVHLYFLRRRLLLERDLRDSSDISHALRISEAEALLDSFTDGAFERMLRRARSSWKTGASTNASGRP